MKKRDSVLFALIGADLAIKACAWAFLRRRDSASPGTSFLRFGYVENRSGFGFDQTRLLAQYGISTNDSFVVCSLAAFLVLALAIALWHRIEARAWIKTLAVAAIYLAVATAALYLHDSISLSLSPYLRGALRAAGPLAVAIALYAAVSRRYYAVASTLFLAGTAGNCASLVLPPFAVIDYLGLYRPSIRAHVYANAADLYLVAALSLFVLVPAYLILRSARSSARRRASSA